MKCLALLALVGTTATVAFPMPQPQGYAYAPAYKPAPKYAPAPAPYAPPKHAAKEHPPQPYAFEYGVADQYSGTNFQAVENQDEKGTVIGKFCFSTFLKH